MPWLFYAQSALAGRLNPTGLAVFALFSVVFSVFLFFFLYAPRGMRAAVFEDGLRAGYPTGFGPIQWIRRRLRSKVGWGEVERVKLMRWTRSQLETQVKVFIARGDAFCFDISNPDDPLEAEVSLTLLERWHLLGGEVEEEDWW